MRQNEVTSVDEEVENEIMEQSIFKIMKNYIFVLG